MIFFLSFWIKFNARKWNFGLTLSITFFSINFLSALQFKIKSSYCSVKHQQMFPWTKKRKNITFCKKKKVFVCFKVLYWAPSNTLKLFLASTFFLLLFSNVHKKCFFNYLLIFYKTILKCPSKITFLEKKGLM